MPLVVYEIQLKYVRNRPLVRYRSITNGNDSMHCVREALTEREIRVIFIGGHSGSKDGLGSMPNFAKVIRRNNS